jgi:hypothetical protein
VLCSGHDLLHADLPRRKNNPLALSGAKQPSPPNTAEMSGTETTMRALCLSLNDPHEDLVEFKQAVETVENVRKSRDGKK